MTEHRVSLVVNGDPVVRHGIESRTTLADFLRQDLELTGTHLGCEHGVCGACTVLIDDEPVRACLVLAAQADGTTVRTIEGLAAGADLHPVQVACLEAMSFQCGFCTPGFLMTMVALLEEHPTLEGVSLREELAGNLCRCTGYQSIVDGLELAVKRSSAGVAEGKG